MYQKILLMLLTIICLGTGCDTETTQNTSYTPPIVQHGINGEELVDVSVSEQQNDMPDLAVIRASGISQERIDTLERTDIEKETSTTNNTIEQERIPTRVQFESNNTSDAPAGQSPYYTVTRVTDGDTIRIQMNGTEETLRLIGINTPETVDPRQPVECFGKEASNRATELLLGRSVRVAADPTQDVRDKYGRLLVYVYRDDGLFFNKHMIEEGYAYEYTYQKPYQYQTEFNAAQSRAKSAEKGLWSPNTCHGEAVPVASVTMPKTNTAPVVPSPVNTTQETSSETKIPSVVVSEKLYTSSHHSATYYYPESCNGWKGLSATNLKSFDTLEALLSVYARTKSPQCD